MSRGRWIQVWTEPSTYGKPWGWMWKFVRPIVHMCPPIGSGKMPCCGSTPFERMRDRLTENPALVTCMAAPEEERAL